MSARLVGSDRTGIRSLAVLFAVLILGPACPAAWAYPIALETTRVALKPQEPGQRSVGELLYRGGLVLASPDAQFGGLSGLLVQPDGSALLAVSDIGSWVALRLNYRDGDLVGAQDGEIAPMRDLQGRSMYGKKADAESLAPFSAQGLKGEVAVGFEGNHRLWRYPFGRAGFASIPTAVSMPDGLRQAAPNQGLEAIARLPNGKLLTVTEATLDPAGNMIGWILDAKSSAPLSLKRREDYTLSDMSALPDGDVLTLERRFNPLTGIFMRLRRIPAASMKPAAVLDGTILAELGPGYSLDNMEGLAVRKGEAGEILLYIVSDDNFSPFERTILLMFELKGSRPTQKRAR